MGRSVLAVVVGFVVWSVLWVGAGAGLRAAFPDAVDAEGVATGAGYLGAVLALSVVVSLISGLITRLMQRTGRAPMALGVVLLLVGLGVEILGWGFAPAWYHVAFLVLLIPATLLGARLAPKGADTASPAAA